MQQLEINTFVAKSTMLHLNEATNMTLYPAVLHDNDIDITARLIVHVLRYESLQSGLNLTHTQDRNFIQVTYIILKYILPTTCTELIFFIDTFHNSFARFILIDFWCRFYALSEQQLTCGVSNLVMLLSFCHCQSESVYLFELQHVVNSIGRILDPRCKDAWHRIQLSRPRALADLLKAVDSYTFVLARNLPQTFTRPFDAVYDNFGTSWIVC